MKATIDGKPVTAINFHQAGDDGEFLWIEFVTEDGETVHTMYFKGAL